MWSVLSSFTVGVVIPNRTVMIRVSAQVEALKGYIEKFMLRDGRIFYDCISESYVV